MDFPDHVIEVQNQLKDAHDIRFKVMDKLVTPRTVTDEMDSDRDYPDKERYIAMWESLERHERNIRGELLNSEWVLDFLNDVIKAQKLPAYMYLKNEKRLELIKKIDDLTSKLSTIYLENSSDVGTRLNKALQRKDIKRQTQNTLFDLDEINKLSGNRLSQLLAAYSNSLILEISSAEFLTKDSKGVEERMFAIALVKRNEWLYNTPLHEVVATAMWAILERNNSATTVLNIVKRSKEF